MPWTLYRYILRDIIRLLVLSTTVLVFVIGFAAAIKPLSDGLLGPAGLVKFILFSTPTMLALALPFAAAFASTMVFCRLTADNEILACSSVGISYRTLLLPVLALGLVLTLGLFFMSNWVIPRFFVLAQQQLEHDMIKVLVNQVQKRQTVSLNRDTVLYADKADDSQPPPVIPGSTIQPTKLVILSGAAAGKYGADGKIVREGTAEQADVYLFHDEGQTWVMMRFKNAMVYDAESEQGHFAVVDHWDLPPVALPNPVRDKPRFMSWPELRELGHEPERFDEVRERKAKLAETIAGEQLLQLIESAMANSGGRGVTFLAAGENQKYQFSTPMLKRDGNAVRLVAAPVKVTYFSGGLRKREMQAKSATLSVETSDEDIEPRVRITLQHVTTSDVWTAQQGGERVSYALERVNWPQPLAAGLKALNINDLYSRARDPHGPFHLSTPVQISADALELSIAKLRRRIIVQVHERAASAVSCALVLLMGAVLSMRMRGGLPLVVYFWSFMLALLAVIIGRSGGNLTGNPSAGLIWGLLAMWVGNIIIGVVFTGVYLKLVKN
ncbi:MAG: LptF/LptG family permease [Planctomycetes bacterium]|nr:LptF/LptG family permease [Planctomycetota bacterium]